MLCAFVCVTGQAHSQVVDSVPVPLRALPDSLTRPPLSPARAFLTTLVLPGYGQSVLRRPTAMIIFSAVEVTGLAMLTRSLQDLNRAKRFSGDSVPASFEVDQATGLLRLDPQTGSPIVATWERNVFAAGLVAARRKHVEDWAAIVVFNHLLAATDALVAAHLWDVDIRLRLEQSPRGMLLIGKFRW